VGDTRLPSREKKLKRLDNGDVAAWTGELGSAMRLLRWFENGEEGEQPGGEARLIVFGKDGIRVFEQGGWFAEDADFMAWGSGFQVALGALHVGASARAAVEAATKVDAHTGGVVITIRVGK
jgi:ATP-dependent protease HslVU (ClpYQ) peptidase subunit